MFFFGLIRKNTVISAAVVASLMIITSSAALAQEQAADPAQALNDWTLLEKEYKALRADRDNILAQVKVAYDERNKAIEDSKATIEKVGQLKAENEQLLKNIEELKKANEQLDDKMTNIELESKDLADQVASMQALNKTLTEENQAMLNRPNTQEDVQFQAPKSMLKIAQDRDKLVRENADLHYNLGVMLSKSGDYKNAAAEFLRASQLRPDDASAYFNLGKLYADYLPEKEKAVEYFKTYLRLQPQAEDSSWVRTFIATFKASRAEEKLF